jgi:thiamine-monophosphate kinase
MFDNPQHTTLDTMGEFALIDHITQHVKLTHANTVKGIGDDAAVLLKSVDTLQVVTTDMLVEGVHFDLMYTPLKHLGYKAVVVNLSDICAMNAVPRQITVSIAVSSKYTLEAIEELYSGIIAACNIYKVDLVGGDTTSSKSGLIISITAIGETNINNITYRHTANENDLICVTGDLGAAYMGLQVLEREKQVFIENPDVQPDIDGHDYIVERQLKPEARIDIIAQLLQEQVVPTSMIDVSDGLASELLHICKASKLGCNVYESKLPIDGVTFQTALDFNIIPQVCAMNGGEDYELLFTIKQEDYDKIKDKNSITVIGHMTAQGNSANLVTNANTILPIEAQGWKHF